MSFEHGEFGRAMVERDRIPGRHVTNEKRRPNKQHEPGRVCEAGGCGTVLSRYNAKTLCAQHDPFLSVDDEGDEEAEAPGAPTPGASAITGAQRLLLAGAAIAGRGL